MPKKGIIDVPEEIIVGGARKKIKGVILKSRDETGKITTSTLKFEPISLDQLIIMLHNQIMAEQNEKGVTRDEATVYFAVYRTTKEKDPIRQAARLIYVIAKQQPFVDGNKRTALMSAKLFLGRQGYAFKKEISIEEQIKFMLSVADHRKNVEFKDIVRWLTNATEKVASKSLLMFRIPFTYEDEKGDYKT
jgi:death-on-curing family protein